MSDLTLEEVCRRFRARAAVQAVRAAHELWLSSATQDTKAWAVDQARKALHDWGDDVEKIRADLTKISIKVPFWTGGEQAPEGGQWILVDVGEGGPFGVDRWASFAPHYWSTDLLYLLLLAGYPQGPGQDLATRFVGALRADSGAMNLDQYWPKYIRVS